MNSEKIRKVRKLLRCTVLLTMLLLCVGAMTAFAGEPKLSLVKTSSGDITFGEEFELEIVNTGDECEIVETEWTTTSDYGKEIEIISSDKSCIVIKPIATDCDLTITAKVEYTYNDNVASPSNPQAIGRDTLRFNVDVEVIPESEFEYRLNEDGETVTILSYLGTESTVDIPNKIALYDVVGIDSSKHNTLRNLTMILPNNIESIVPTRLYDSLFLVEPNTVSESSVIAAKLVYADSNGDVFMQCGRNATWSLNIYSGQCMIKGTGLVDDYSYPRKYLKYTRNVTIEDGILNIPEYAFSKSDSPIGPDFIHASSNMVLESVSIPNSVTKIEEGAFAGCDTFVNLTLPEGITHIDDGVFYECKNLETIVLPSTLKGLGYSAFRGCESLKEINIPVNVKTISDCLFKGCTNLEKVVLPNNLKSIIDNAFDGCASLKKIVLPSNFEVLYGYAFENCTSLEEITIPAKTKRVYLNAFKGCTNLKKVTFLNANTEIAEGVFSGAYDVVIYGYTGSTADSYAKTYSIPFVSLGNSSSGGTSGGSSGGSGGGGSSSGGGGGGGSSSGGSGGGGGGGSSKKTTTTTTNAVALPEYVVKGTWTATAEGNWTFTDASGLAYKTKWAAVYNPYANTALGQENFDWFYFDANGNMATGWILDNGLWYYLSPVSDGTKGKMVTGWLQIDGNWYYFNPESDGTRGAMKVNTWIGNYHLNENGIWDTSR